ncbi:MAG TPA: hypothetical protein VGM56_00050 [Byssovorax sp.]|jgi:hypothetical protein
MTADASAADAPKVGDGDEGLALLGGQRPGRDLVDDAARFAALPDAARARIWDVLGPSLAEPVPRAVEAIVKRFGEAHGVDGTTVARAVRAGRVALRAAAALDLDAARFEADLVALAGGARALADALLPGYDRAKARVRAELAQRTVADHGRLLERVQWRVDTLGSSDRVVGLRLPVVTLTLHYREAGKLEQLSVQVLPDVLRQLRGVCDRVLGRR